MRRGRFVVFEGGEGTGKSTQAQILAERWGAVATREPGGTALGAELRRVLLDPATGSIDLAAETLLMAADRAQHVAEVIEPALASGRDVVCDRYIGSSVAYQGHGRGIEPDFVARLSEWATSALLPDLVVLLVVPESVSRERLGGDLDRFEQAGDDFHRRVSGGFLLQAAADPDRWVVVDGLGSVAEVSERVAGVLDGRFDPPG